MSHLLLSIPAHVTGKIVGRLSDITNQQTHSHVKDCNIAKTSKGVSDKQSGQNRPFTAPKVQPVLTVAKLCLS